MTDFIQKALSRNKDFKEKHLISKLLRSGIKNEMDHTAVNFQIKGFKAELLPGVAADQIERMLNEV